MGVEKVRYVPRNPGNPTTFRQDIPVIPGAPEKFEEKKRFVFIFCPLIPCVFDFVVPVAFFLFKELVPFVAVFPLDLLTSSFLFCNVPPFFQGLEGSMKILNFW